jgi:hypothetical protein
VQGRTRPSGARTKKCEDHPLAVGRQGNGVGRELPGRAVFPRDLHLVDGVEESPPAKWAIDGRRDVVHGDEAATC